MLIKFDAKLNKDTRKDIWINPRFIVSVVDSYPKSNEGHSELTTCAMVGEDESECWVVKGKAEDIAIRCNHYTEHISPHG